MDAEELMWKHAEKPFSFASPRSSGSQAHARTTSTVYTAEPTEAELLDELTKHAQQSNDVIQAAVTHVCVLLLIREMERERERERKIEESETDREKKRAQPYLLLCLVYE
jgi:hypothetical protein